MNPTAEPTTNPAQPAIRKLLGGAILLLIAVAMLAGPSNASAILNNVRIMEVHPGTAAVPTAEYTVVQARC